MAKNILLIDNDVITNFLNVRLLERIKFVEEVNVALNGKEAINFLKIYSVNSGLCPELIFLDLKMPVMDGFEFLENFQSLNFINKDRVKIVLLTTSTHIIDMKKVESFGVNIILNKPLTKELLIDFMKENFNELIF